MAAAAETHHAAAAAAAPGTYPVRSAAALVQACVDAAKHHLAAGARAGSGARREHTRRARQPFAVAARVLDDVEQALGGGKSGKSGGGKTGGGGKSGGGGGKSGGGGNKANAERERESAAAGAGAGADATSADAGADADADAAPPAAARTGKVLNWNAARGFGFIQPDGGGDNVFCHVSAIADGGALPEGGAVSFEMGLPHPKSGKRGAANVTGGCAPPRPAQPARGGGGGGGGGGGATKSRWPQPPGAPHAQSSPLDDAPRVCRFWNGTPGSCRAGDACTFAHVDGDGVVGGDPRALALLYSTALQLLATAASPWAVRSPLHVSVPWRGGRNAPPARAAADLWAEATAAPAGGRPLPMERFAFNAAMGAVAGTGGDGAGGKSGAGAAAGLGRVLAMREELAAGRYGGEDTFSYEMLIGAAARFGRSRGDARAPHNRPARHRREGKGITCFRCGQTVATPCARQACPNPRRRDARDAEDPEAVALLREWTLDLLPELKERGLRPTHHTYTKLVGALSGFPCPAHVPPARGVAGRYADGDGDGDDGAAAAGGVNGLVADDEAEAETRLELALGLLEDCEFEAARARQRLRDVTEGAGADASDAAAAADDDDAVL